MKRVTLGAALALAALAVTPPSASAAPPSCPPSFYPNTLAQQIVQGTGLGIPEAAVRALFAAINTNQDAIICNRKIGVTPTSYVVIDNRVVGRER